MTSRIFASVIFACVAATPAFAADCGPLKLISNIDLLPGPGGGPRLMVPVIINNTPQKMLLGTAGAYSTLTETAAKALNLHPVDGSHIRLLDAAGHASTRYVTTESFQMGQLLGHNMEFLISPDRTAGANGAFDGTLAGDLMSHYDVEIDFAAHKMYYFSQDHCEGKVLHWQASAVAVVPFKMEHPMTGIVGEASRQPLNQDTHIRVPVTLDGKSFLAVIDTGAVRSTMSAKTARIVFGLTADSPGSVPLGMVDNDPKNKIFGHVFDSLTFEGIAVSNPHIAIIPDLIGSKDPSNTVATGSSMQRVDDGLGSEVTVGMDVLKSLHLYIAYNEQKLYITAGGGAAAASNAPTAPSAPAGAPSNPAQ